MVDDVHELASSKTQIQNIESDKKFHHKIIIAIQTRRKVLIVLKWIQIWQTATNATILLASGLEHSHA